MYLKQFREKMNLTQKEFAEKLGMAQNALARYENDKVTPSITVISQYIDVFDANPLFLFCGIEPIFLNQQKEVNTRHHIDVKKAEIIELEKSLGK